MSNRHLLVIVTGLLACLTAACDATNDKGSTSDAGDSPEASPGEDAATANPIAPNCEESFCAEVEVNAALQCHNAISNEGFSMTTRVSGRTTEVSCAIEDTEGAGQDLRIGVKPHEAPAEDASAAWFLIRNYEGAGTYPLIQLEEEDSHHGFELSGNTSDAEGRRTVGTLYCLPSPCEAIVAPETEPVPNESSTVKEWRVRVEVKCGAGNQLSDMHCAEDARILCTFDEAPTLRFDVACRT